MLDVIHGATEDFGPFEPDFDSVRQQDDDTAEIAPKLTKPEERTVGIKIERCDYSKFDDNDHAKKEYYRPNA